MDPIVWIVVISVIGPIVGSALGVLRNPSFGYICNMLCFAAGAMLAISFLDLIPESIRLSSQLACMAGFLIGALAMYGMDRLLPHIHPRLCSQEQGCNLERTSVYLMPGIFLHNFPEGMAIAIGAVRDIRVSLTIALAIAVHDIPEGICTSAPYYLATNKRGRAFVLSSFTAVPTVLGYLIARYLFFDLSTQVLGIIVAAMAGLMVYFTADELIPHSCAGSNHQTIFSLMAGILFLMGLGFL
ncbi:MAG: ZIP family metal transporter [Deltaproteobacteria bacterium]|nr:ZIP family metal transporter [Deltaproteobacteria bacterium]